ncbi:PAS domain-containing protein [Thalassobaculum sp. OXR-137]|uniref:PAS domain-containing protein n=1 Tax=Thalassobaculum sp. OXR-137 TaxID=3100173 RepID=UPI002AC999AE|nr:PAS domain-containing protein [Thalassobaculum sp. OXR-137]WPZ33427.1 PAS domain-containing protein [Thalassobaculum sp. OXR-137]
MKDLEERAIWLSSQSDGASLDNPQLLRLFDYWKAAARGGPAPRRDDIDPPIDFPSYLPTTIMFDVERPEAGPLQFRYRLMGTQLVDFAGRDLKGLTLEEAFGADSTRDVAIYRQVVETCSCYSGQRISMIESRQMFERYRRIVMPILGNESGQVDRIWTWITYTEFSPEP